MAFVGRKSLERFPLTSKKSILVDKNPRGDSWIDDLRAAFENKRWRDFIFGTN